MATVFADPKNRRNPIKDLGSALYGAATQAYGLGGDFGIPGLPDTQETRGEVRKLTKKVGWDPEAPGQEGAVDVGGIAPAVAGAAGLVKGLAPSAGRVLAKAGDFTSDLVKGLKPRTLIEGVGKPSTISDVGENITRKVGGNLDKLVKERQPQARKMFDEYLAKGKASEGQILDDYKKGLASYYAEGVTGGKLSPEQASAIQKAADRISGRVAELGKTEGDKIAPGIEALEKERRFWQSVAEGYEVKGAEAIPAAAAKDIAELLTNTIRKYAPKEFDAAMKGYTELSAPINKFNTALGKRTTSKADDFLPEVAKTDPAMVPQAFFKSRRSVQELKELSGDEKFAEEAARSHVANDLSRATTRKKLDKYLQKNRDWLQEFPALQKQLMDATKTIGRGEGAKKTAKYGALALGAGGALSGANHLLGGP